MHKYLLTICLFLTSLLPAHQHELSICAIFQNESQWIKEWIEFYQLMGVDHFYLYNHRSTDQPEKVLQPYIDSGHVTMVDWDIPEGQQKAQIRAYNDFLRQFGSATKWVAILDIDEFLFPVREQNLKSFLKQYESFAGLAVNWVLYGTSFVESLAPNELLIERLTLRASLTDRLNKRIKSIFQPDKVEVMVDSHYARYKAGHFAVDSNLMLVADGSNARVPLDKIRINHYYFRTLDWTRGEKIARREKMLRALGQDMSPDKVNKMRRDWLYYDKCSYNKEQDTTIQRFLPQLKQAMGGNDSN